jgi:hypothetical protein
VKVRDGKYMVGKTQRSIEQRTEKGPRKPELGDLQWKNSQKEAPRNPAKYRIHHDPHPRSLPNHFILSFNPIAIDAITIATATAKATKSSENKDLNVMVKVDSGTVIVTTSVLVTILVIV